MEAVVFSTIAYFLFGFSLADGGARYLYFLLAIFVLSFSMFGLIVCGAALFPTEEISMAVLPIGLFTLILYSGFLIVKDQAPRWVFWITYLSPFYYLQGGLAMNELIDRDFDCEDDEVNNLLGAQLSPLHCRESLLIVFKLMVCHSCS